MERIKNGKNTAWNENVPSRIFYCIGVILYEIVTRASALAMTGGGRKTCRATPRGILAQTFRMTARKTNLLVLVKEC